MTTSRKLFIGVLIIATIALAVISFIILQSVNQNQGLQDSNAQTSTGGNNCDPLAQSCTVQVGVCNPSRGYIHFCDDIKAEGVNCVSTTPIEIENGNTLPEGSVISINNYIQDRNCGTAQLYLELPDSGISSIGACGSLTVKFDQPCSDSNIPVSFPTTIPDDVEEQPEEINLLPQFSITKSAVTTCDTDGNGTIDYTITVTNIGQIAGTINNLKDNIDIKLPNNNIIPQSIDSGGIYSAGVITWTGDLSARNFEVEQSKQYKYRITVPQEKLTIFKDGINDQSIAEYDTSEAIGNTASFNLKTLLTCTIQSLPKTAILDDLRFILFGIMFIIVGYIIYKNEISKKFGLNVINNVDQKVKGIKKQSRTFIPFEEGIEQNIKEKIKDKS